jgi:uroporphyrinogen-III decarboxylase
MYDEPELVHNALSLISDTYAAFLDKWYEIFPSNSYMNPHWNTIWHRGKIFLRCDSAMNLSPEFYEEFAAPYDARLLERFDGGCMHFCGRGDHYVETLCNIPKLYGINLGQPLHNDMEKIFKNSVDKGIKVLGFIQKTFDSLEKRPCGYNHSLHVR